MYDLTIVSPAATTAADVPGDVSFLWHAEAKPLPKASPTADTIQEIVIGYRTEDELLLTFDTRETELTQRVAGVCNSLYVEGGIDAVNRFLASIEETGWEYRSDGPFPIPESRIPTVQGERYYVGASESPRRHALKLAVEAWLEWIRQFSEEVVKRVEPAAGELAVAKLIDAAQSVMTQSSRYFGGPHGAANYPVVDKDSIFTSEDTVQLVESIVQIAAMRREVEIFQEDAAAARSAVRKVGLVDNTGLGPALLHAAVSQDLRGMLDVPGASSALARSTQGLEAANRVLAQACSTLCRVHPVLYRLWDDRLVLEIADLWNNTPGAQRMDAIKSDGRLAQALATLLNDTARVARGLISDLDSSPVEIWKYPSMIEAALRGLHLHQADIAWRAATDYLEERSGALSPIAKAGLGLGVIEMIAATAGVAPPVAAVLALLSAGAGIADLIGNAMDEARKDRAFQACLDPADSLVLEGGSYTGIVVGSLFILLQLRGAQSAALKAVRLP